MQAAQDGVGDILIGKFFDVGYFAACGLSPAYKRYVRCKYCMYVFILYGVSTVYARISFCFFKLFYCQLIIELSSILELKL